MALIRELLNGISLIKGTLTFWAFFVAALVVVTWVIMRSDKFNEIWSKVIGKKLRGTQLFKLLRLLLILFFLTAIILIILAFSSPLILDYMKTSKEMESLVRSESDRVLLGIKISDEEKQRFKEKFKIANRIFREEKDYEKARAYFFSLKHEAEKEITKESISGLITNSYYKDGEHREGLKFVCRNYFELSHDDFRYRFDIHAHIRRIALNEGIAAAEAVIRKLYAAYGREDLSYVWIGIPLAKMEYLKKGYTVIEENYYLSEDDEAYLKKAIKRYPDDKFIDHAYYFLHEFETVINNYPNSLILEVAYLSAGQTKSGLEAAKFYSEYLKKWPDSPKKEYVEKRLLKSYATGGSLDDALDCIKKYDRLTYDDMPPRYFRYFSRHMNLSQVLKVLKKHEKLDLLTGEAVWNYFDDGEEHYKNRDYEKALQLYLNQKKLYQKYKVHFPGKPKKKINELKRMIHLSKDITPQGLLKSGLFLRDKTGRIGLAIKTWQECANAYPTDIEAEKSIYLIASGYRRMGYYTKSTEVLRQFYQKYPESVFADDAIAEIGVYYLLLKRDFKTAKSYFDKVFLYYPDSNASDNALNWMGWYLLNEGKYVHAAKYYSSLIVQYPQSRLGKRAKKTRKKLNIVLDSQKKRKAVAGLKLRNISWREGVYIADVEKDSPASKIGFKYTDVIQKINGIDVQDTDSFYSALARCDEGEVVDIQFLRGTDKTLNVQAKVCDEPIYTITYRNAELYLFRGIIRNFIVTKYLVLQSKNNDDEILGLYAGEVDYFKEGMVDKAAIRADKQRYYSRWPERKYTISSKIQLSYIRKPDLIKVKFNYNYVMKGKKKSLSGEAWCELILQEEHLSFVIVSERGGTY